MDNYKNDLTFIIHTMVIENHSNLLEHRQMCKINQTSFLRYNHIENITSYFSPTPAPTATA